MFVKKEGYYLIEEFLEHGVYALYTDKDSGNMSADVLNEPVVVKDNINKIMEKFGKTDFELFSSKQIHEDKIYIVEENEKGKDLEGYDSFITNNKNAVILTKYADCLPVYFMDKKKGIIGISHSGWKGSLAGISLKTVVKMEKKLGADKKDMIVGIGIGMKSCCYEVGLDVYDKFRKKFSHELIKKSFKIEDRRIYFDNENFNYEILKKYGIPEQNIIKSELCTGCSGNFFSYRKEKEKSGRNAGIIFLKQLR